MVRDGEPIGIVTVLARIAFLVNTAYAEAGRATGTTPQQGQLLCMLRPGPWGFGALTEALGLAKSSVSGLVDGVEARGFVVRERGADARATTVALTRAGSHVADRFYAVATTRVDAQLEPMDEDARRAAAELLRPVVETRRFSVVFPQPEANSV